MTALLGAIMGRLPIGWLQLIHSKTRLAAAMAGVAFANILVLVQLGIMGSLNNSILISYDLLDADIMISAENANTLTEGDNVARQRMFQALAVPGVQSALPFYVATADWERADGETTAFTTFGIDPKGAAFLNEELAPFVPLLRLRDTAVVDRGARGVDPDTLASISPGNPLRFEVSGVTLSAVDTMVGGGGFAGDGYMLVSDQTFHRIFANRSTGAPDHILVKIAADADPDAVLARLQAQFDGTGLRVRGFQDAALEDQAYQTTERPTGLIFGFGVVIGILVGIVIVYQILSTDVADHLAEYATFKAMGYGQSMFLGIVLEQAVILGILGFVPGVIVSWLLYEMLGAVTGLPVELTVATTAAVFAGTIIACLVSGAIATRRLAAADPADLF
ncbi:MAG: FtsX-like permease family protein [Roseitalea sp.]|jgi:putative ABC transport system permease protein|nr:FtsX-like permease family protein [Roseitalea sp.]MBO6722264.1 FtsX-like permease family protein [Roseitalea sp.]MBO6742407.1 FtsX-like permease family protein [Roseitalea sp.]